MTVDQPPRATHVAESTNDPAADHTIALARLIGEGRLSREIGVTRHGRRDGVGMQAMTTIAAMAVARFAGCRYFHSPFTSMEHAQGPAKEWAQRWEQFLNFGDGESPVPKHAELVQLSEIVENASAYADRPVIIAEKGFNLPPAVGVPIRETLRSELRKRYWRSSKSAVPSHRGPANGLTVAIHVRRGDVNPITPRGRYVRDELVLRRIEQVKKALAPFGRRTKLNLYSEGRPEDFGAFAQAGCHLHISEDAIETFHNMVTADVLVDACSGFSYLAGFLSEGIVVDHRRRAPRYKNWIGRRKNGSVSTRRLRRLLIRRMSWYERCIYQIRRFTGLRSRNLDLVGPSASTDAGSQP
ncbi:MAG: hypothetical protein R3D05_15820 [Dongiaceae bacterium]